MVAASSDLRRLLSSPVITREEQRRAMAAVLDKAGIGAITRRSEEHTSELQSLMRISYAVFCLKKKTSQQVHNNSTAIIPQIEITAALTSSLDSTSSTTAFVMCSTY